MTQALEEDGPEALDFIDAAVSRMDQLTRAILELSREGRRELRLDRVPMETLAKDIVQTLSHQLAQRQAQITIDPLPDVRADRTAMGQILGNLLSNAVNYLQPGRPGEITLTAEPGPEMITFHVQDNGRGIAADDMSKVIEPFRRAGAPDVPGEGMGLSYVRMLVRRHGGDIRCDSTLEVGTTFTLNG